MTTAIDLDRRSFIKIVGGGIVVLVSLGPTAFFGQDRRRSYPTDVNAYLRIGDDGRVAIFSGKIEMGQGVLTSQAQMAADELGVSLDAIDMILGDTDRCPWDMGTFGSLTTRMFGPALRAACAEARGVMMQLASERLGVAKDDLVVEDGVVSVKGDSTRRVSYGGLAKGKAILRTVDDKVLLRSISEFRAMGRSPRRLDAKEKVTGQAKYAGDIRLPGMLYARIVRPPAHGAKLAKIDASAAAKMSGVTVVNRDGLVAVLHADPEIAGKALEAVKAGWSQAAPGADQEGIFEDLLKRAGEPEVTGAKGDLQAALGAGAKRFAQTYHKGYVAHAPMEPHAAVAEMKEGHLTIWASTQTPFPTRDRIARMLNLDASKVRVVTPYVGGGFGGKSAGLQADEAAKLAVITGKPVMVAWTRAEEFFHDTFDPACIVKINSAVDANGRISMWDYTVWYAGARSTEFFYDVSNVRVRVSGGPMGPGSDTHRFGVGPWRAPGANMNVWARESQIDIMAAAVGVDPLEFRLRNLKDERMIGVLNAAAKKFGWKPAPAPSGRGVAVACGIDAGTYAALMAEVKVDRKNGTVKVERVVCAQDMGIVVNPDGATMQVEGSVTQGLGYVFTEELRFRGGDILDRNFDTYELPRFSWVPAIETVLVRNDGLQPQGGGEPAIVPMGAVIANAVFDASGARVTRLPITPKRLKEALEGSQGRVLTNSSTVFRYRVG
jgi:isoquinoline 1-oxidoreductase